MYARILPKSNENLASIFLSLCSGYFIFFYFICVPFYCVFLLRRVFHVLQYLLMYLHRPFFHFFLILYLLNYPWIIFLRLCFFHFVASYLSLCFLYSRLLAYSFLRLSVNSTSLRNVCNDKSITFSSVPNCFNFVL